MNLCEYLGWILIFGLGKWAKDALSSLKQTIRISGKVSGKDGIKRIICSDLKKTNETVANSFPEFRSCNDLSVVTHKFGAVAVRMVLKDHQDPAIQWMLGRTWSLPQIQEEGDEEKGMEEKASNEKKAHQPNHQSHSHQPNQQISKKKEGKEVKKGNKEEKESKEKGGKEEKRGKGDKGRKKEIEEEEEEEEVEVDEAWNLISGVMVNDDETPEEVAIRVFAEKTFMNHKSDFILMPSIAPIGVYKIE